MFRKALEDGQVLPHNIVHKDKKFTFKYTDDEKVTLDVEDHNIMEYNYLDENFSLCSFCYLFDDNTSSAWQFVWN